MRTVTKILSHKKIAATLLKEAPTLTLAYLERSKSRQKVTLNTGEEVILNLPRGGVMRGGDILVADDGQFISVISALERVLRVTASNMLNLLQSAYHLGNRHTPIEIGDAYLQLEHDPVLADLLARLGAQVEIVERPFEPEHGAYGGGHKHGHDETFAEDYQLAQAAYHVHDHSHEHSHHVHDEHCGHKH